MIDIYEITHILSTVTSLYLKEGLYMRAWNFHFMDNLYNFGKDFK